MKVHSVSYDKFTWEKYRGHYRITSDCLIFLNTDDGLVPVMVEKGFELDGGSVPRIFQWFIPGWSNDNQLLNIAYTLHDAFYQERGFGEYSREDVDDMLRGIIREAGYGRFKAGMVDKAVEWFAGGSSHWGNISYPGNVGKVYLV